MVQVSPSAKQMETDVENIHMDAKGGRGMNWEIGIDMYTLPHVKQIANENLLHSTGNAAKLW